MLPDSHLEKAGYLNGMQASGPKNTGAGAVAGGDLLIFGNT
jgi:hypothetical protein